MKARLNFKLPEEQEFFDDAIRVAEYKNVIEEILLSLREKLIYGALSDEQYHAVESIQAEIIHLIRRRGLKL